MIAVPSLPQALEAGLRNQEDDWGDSRVHVSDLAVAIGEKCARQLWLRLSGAKKKDLTAGQLLMFDHAHRIHERLIEVIRENLNNGWHIQAVEKQVSIGDVTGRYDTRLWHDGEGWEIIVDFKTMRGRAFGYFKDAKPAHVLQVQAYTAAADADGGLIFYVDREGQNAARQFYVQRDDARVWAAIQDTLLVAQGSDPGILAPQVQVKQNKGPDSVYLKMPWNCDYCEFIDVSCPGALPKKMRELGIVGKINGSVFSPAKDVPPGVESVVREYLEIEVIPF